MPPRALCVLAPAWALGKLATVLRCYRVERPIVVLVRDAPPAATVPRDRAFEGRRVGGRRRQFGAGAPPQQSSANQKRILESESVAVAPSREIEPLVSLARRSPPACAICSARPLATYARARRSGQDADAHTMQKWMPGSSHSPRTSLCSRGWWRILRSPAEDSRRAAHTLLPPSPLRSVMDATGLAAHPGVSGIRRRPRRCRRRCRR